MYDYETKNYNFPHEVLDEVTQKFVEVKDTNDLFEKYGDQINALFHVKSDLEEFKGIVKSLQMLIKSQQLEILQLSETCLDCDCGK